MHVVTGTAVAKSVSGWLEQMLKNTDVAMHDGYVNIDKPQLHYLRDRGRRWGAEGTKVA